MSGAPMIPVQVPAVWTPDDAPGRYSDTPYIPGWDNDSTSSSSFDGLGVYSEDVKESEYASTGFPTTEESDDDRTESERSLTPTPSVRTFNSDNENEFLREQDGRLFNAQNELYPLPADHVEFDRLELQHKCLTYTIGGLYIPKEAVETLLADDGSEKAIMDAGCGGGNWAIEMANKYPHCQIVGIDLAPITCKPLPPNCRFEFDDFTLGLPHYYNCFDLIHARSIANGVDDFPGIMDELARCLRPGGILLMAEGNFQLLNSDLQPIDACWADSEQGPNRSWHMRFLSTVYSTMKSRGTQMDAGLMLKRWMQESTMLEQVEGRRVLVPNGPWRTDPDPAKNSVLQWVGTAQRKNMKEFCLAVRPALISEGYFPHFIDDLIAKASEEMDSMKLKVYCQYFYAWARRPASHQDDVAHQPASFDLNNADGRSSPGSASVALSSSAATPSSSGNAADESDYAESVISSSVGDDQEGLSELARGAFRLPPPTVLPAYSRHSSVNPETDSDASSSY